MKLTKILKYPLLLLLLGASIHTARAQNIKAALLLGFNASQVDGDDMAGYHKFGLNGGAMAILPFKKKFSASFEITYAQKGAKSFFNPEFPQEDFRYTMDYLEIPVLLNYHDKENIFFSAGGSVGILVRYREVQQGLEVPVNEIPVNKRDYSTVLSGTYLFAKHWGVNLRFSYSLFPIAYWPDISNRKNFKVSNNVITVRLVYQF